MNLLSRFVEILRVVGAISVGCDEVETALDRIGQKQEAIMAKFADMKAAVTGVKTEMVSLAERVQAVIDKVHDSDLTGPEEDEILSDLVGIKDGLTLIAKTTDEIPLNP